MTMLTLTRHESASDVKPTRSAGASTYRAWVARAPTQPLVFDTIDPGPLGDEEAEVAVEHCGLCHSDLSVLNNDWGVSRYPAVLGHEVVGRVTALGPAA